MLIYEASSNAPLCGVSERSMRYKSARKTRTPNNRVKVVSGDRRRKKSTKKSSSKRGRPIKGGKLKKTRRKRVRRTIKGGKVKKLKKKNINFLKKLGIRVKKR